MIQYYPQGTFISEAVTIFAATVKNAEGALHKSRRCQHATRKSLMRQTILAYNFDSFYNVEKLNVFSVVYIKRLFLRAWINIARAYISTFKCLTKNYGIVL